MLVLLAVALGVGLGIGLNRSKEDKSAENLNTPAAQVGGTNQTSTGKTTPQSTTKPSSTTKPHTWIELPCMPPGGESHKCPWKKNPLLLFSLDGFRADYLTRNMTPTIQKLSTCGVHTPYMRSVYPTLTFPNHYTIVTGLYPESHGIVNNNMYDPIINKTLTLYGTEKSDPKWWGGEPIWITAKKQGKRSAAYFWVGTDVNITGQYPDVWNAYDGKITFEARIDTALEWLSLPEHKRPDLILLYVNEPDHTGHGYGPDKEKVDEMLVKVDKLISRLMNGLYQKQIHNCVNMMIMADHGMEDTSCDRKVLLNNYINIKDKLIFDGTIGTIHENYHATTKKDSDVVLKNTQEMKIATVWKAIMVLTNLYKSMQALFLAHGPDFKQNIKTEPFENIELYNTMCDLLGIKPAPNNGTLGALSHILHNPTLILSRKLTNLKMSSIPFGEPRLSEHIESCKLQNGPYTSGYSWQHKMPIWSSFVLIDIQKFSNISGDFCSIKDSRIPSKASASCSDYENRSQEISYVFLDGTDDVVPVPTHFYIILMKCNDSTIQLDLCQEQGIQILSFILPHVPTITNCMGLYPESHGIISNKMYDEDIGEVFTIGGTSKANPQWWGGEPLWITAKKQGKKTATFFWPGSDVNISGVYPDMWKLYDGKVGYPERVYTIIDWLTLPEGEKPDFVTLYFDQPDHIAHSTGPDDGQVNAQLQTVDDMLFRLMDALYHKGLHNCVNIIVIADHGFDHTSCSQLVKLPNYITNITDLLIFDGTFGRIQPQFHRLKETGRDKYTVFPNDYVRPAETIVDELMCKHKEMKVFTKDTVPRRHHYFNNPRMGDILLDVADQWLVTRTNSYFCSGGNHGWDNLYKAMHALFLAHGPAFKKKIQTDSFENIELYNLMCDFVYPDADMGIFIDSNSVPMYDSFKNGIWKSLFGIIKEYNKKFGDISVITGPAYDNDGDALADSLTDLSNITVHANSSIPLPTHYFVILTKCSNGSDILPCKTGVDVQSFILPHTDGIPNCLSDKDFLQDNVARVKDVELLTGLEFFTKNYSISEHARLQTYLPVKIWPSSLTETWLDTNCETADEKCSSEYQPLLLISLDGFRADYLLRNLTPNIKRFLKCGVHAPYMRSVFPTKTFPNHYSIVTGLYPESHGIIDNNMYDKNIGERFGLGKPNASDPRWWGGDPIWNTVRKHNKTSATFFWPGSDVEVNGEFLEYLDVTYSERVQQILKWMDMPSESRPDFMTLYFEEPDKQGHIVGPDDTKINLALAKVDKAIGELMEGLLTRQLHNCVNIIIIADHGMADTSCNRLITFMDYLTSTYNKYIYDGPFGRINPNYRYSSGKIVPVENPDNVSSIMANLTCHPHFKAYRKEELPVRYHYVNNDRIDPIVIDVEDKWLVTYRSLSRYGERYCSGGNHGYDNRYKSMRALFLAHGPEFRQNVTVNAFENIELYNLMTDILKIKASPNNGTRGSLNHVLRSPPVHAVELFHTYRNANQNFTVADYLRLVNNSDCSTVCPTVLPEKKHEIAALLYMSSMMTHPDVTSMLPHGLPRLMTDANVSVLYQPMFVTGYGPDIQSPLWIAFSFPKMLNFLIDNIFVVLGGKVFQQIVGIPMGTNCAPLLADIFLYSYEAEFIQSLVSEGKRYLASDFNFTYRYIDDVLSINNPKFADYLSSIYPSELDVKETTETNNSASYLDIMFSYDTDGHMNTSLYDKRDDFNFSITNFPFLSSNIPSSPAYGVFISQLIRYARASTKYTDFVLRARRLSDKLLSQGYVCDRLTSSLRKFYGRYGRLVIHYDVPLSRMVDDILS
ncbi:hypothetical protein FSP39_008300 [Pinctada imbricata]|uniref:ENPP1-3/EXOG-like endonuclease/phosphodiesterase domain-containing protein n=1 Tax=Pinctada imbricata TaxID=66713 RepID=A0AA89BT20_PINIB|nr:hypothetical protein FSP39_008300 [Pinctada imbricata]